MLLFSHSLDILKCQNFHHQQRLQEATVTTNAIGHPTTNKRTQHTEGPTISWNNAFKDQVALSINEILQRFPCWSPKRMGAWVAQSLWEQSVNLPEVLKFSYFRDNKVFTLFNVLPEMDLKAGGTLSYEGMNILCWVKTVGLKQFRGSMIHLKSKIKPMTGMVEWYAHPRCPAALNQTSKGKSVEFDFAKSMLCIMQAFHLDEVGRYVHYLLPPLDWQCISVKRPLIIAGDITIIVRGSPCPLTRNHF